MNKSSKNFSAEPPFFFFQAMDLEALSTVDPDELLETFKDKAQGTGVVLVGWKSEDERNKEVSSWDWYYKETNSVRRKVAPLEI